MPKDSFIVYRSFWEAMKKLPDKERLEIHDAIYMYHFEGNELQLSTFVDAIFSILKSQFDRDTAKYETIIERNRINGSKGGRPAKNPENPVGYLGNPEKPKETLYEDDTDTVDETETEKEVEEKPETVLQPTPTETPKQTRKKRVQPDALQFPFSSAEFMRLWAELAATPKWVKKEPSALQASLNQLGRYDERFSVKLIENAIAGRYQGVVFSDTDQAFAKWQRSFKTAVNSKTQIDSPIADHPEWD